MQEMTCESLVLTCDFLASVLCGGAFFKLQEGITQMLPMPVLGVVARTDFMSNLKKTATVTVSHR